ncbi:transposase [Pseudomonas brassicacearum]
MKLNLKFGQNLWRGGFVGAKLARDTGASISERPHRLHRGQALLPQITSPQKRVGLGCG